MNKRNASTAEKRKKRTYGPERLSLASSLVALAQSHELCTPGHRMGRLHQLLLDHLMAEAS